MRGKIWIIVALCVVIGALALRFGPNVLLHGTPQTCLDAPGSERCKFDGGPLRMAGTPQFLDGFEHAFLPLEDGISFTDANGEIWQAPPRTLTDGASIPVIFTPLIGDRQSREFLMAAALHDAYCGLGNEALSTFQSRDWEAVHRMFFEALVVGGTPPRRAKVMFAAVYLGGPRWNAPDRALDTVGPKVLQRELEYCLRWMEENDPSLDDIISWMKDRESVLRAATG